MNPFLNNTGVVLGNDKQICLDTIFFFSTNSIVGYTDTDLW